MPSQDGSVETLSMRIITTEYSMEKPVAHLDVTSSSFRKTNVRRVPVIHLFGSTKQGERMCMHVHGVFPYVYVALEHEPDEAYLQRLAQAVDKAINLSLGRPSSYSQHVFNISIVHGIPYYGFHHKTSVYLKIYLYNAMLISRLSDLLLSGAVMGRSFQPHEAHIPYMLQFFIDYNLYGMNYINVSAFVERKPTEDAAPVEADSQVISGETSVSHSSTSDPVYKVSVCREEVDVVAADVLNKRLIDAHIGTNPGLLALWEDERKRLRAKGLEDEISLEAPASQERSNAADVGVDRDWYERFLNMVDALDIANDEDKQSFVLPSSGELSSLNLSDNQSEDDVVNEQSISELLNFNANLTQAAAQMSCRELAALLANQSESDEESISYSPKVSPIKGAATSHTHPPPNYSPVVSSEGEVGEDTLTDNTLENPSRPLSAASDERSMSVLSGSSFTSQGSRRSRSSLYRWNKKWSQRSTLEREGSTGSATPVSQSIEQLLSGSPTPSQMISGSAGSLSAGMSAGASMSGRSSFVPSQKSALLNSSLFSDDGDDEDWLEAACSDQLRTTASGFDELYQDLAGESSDEDQETTLMTQPVWDGADEDSNSETIPQVDGAHDDDGEESQQADETTFQVSNQKHPLKLTFKKSLSLSEDTPPSAVANPLKMTFRRTSANVYTNDLDQCDQGSVADEVGEVPADKPKITLNIKSLTEKIQDTVPKKKKHKTKEKSHKKEKHKSKKEKRNRDADLVDLQSTSHHSKSLSHTHLPCDNVREDSSERPPCPSLPPSSSVSVPKLTFAKRGDQFTIKKQATVSPLKLKLQSSTLERPTEAQQPPEAPAAPQSLNLSSQSPTMLKLLTKNALAPLDTTEQVNDGRPSVGDKGRSLSLESEASSNALSKPESGRLLSKRSKAAIKLDKHGKFTVSKEPEHAAGVSATKSPATSKKVVRRRVNSNPPRGRVSNVLTSSPRCSSANTTVVPLPIPAAPMGPASTAYQKAIPVSGGDSISYPVETSAVESTHTAPTHRSSVQTGLQNQLPATNFFDMPLSGPMVGNNASVFPQPIMVLQPEKVPNQLPASRNRSVPKTNVSKLVNGGQTHISGPTHPSPSQQVDGAKLTACTVTEKCSDITKSATPNVTSAVQSPDPTFLQTMNLKRVAETPSKNVHADTGPAEKCLTGNDSLEASFSSLPRDSLQTFSVSAIASASAKALVPTPDNNPPTEHRESGEQKSSDLYSNFLKTKLGQQPVTASPSQHSMDSSDISANSYERGPPRSSPCDPTSNSPLSSIESSQTAELKLPLQIENNATHNMGAPLPNVGMPKVQQGVFRKKKKSKSKHANIHRRPHGCRNVPSGVLVTNPLPALPSHLVAASPPYSAGNNETRDPIRLTFKKLKSPTGDEVRSLDFSAIQSTSYVLPDQSTTLQPSTDTTQNYNEITTEPVECLQDDSLNMSEDLSESASQIAEGAENHTDKTASVAGVSGNLVRQDATDESAIDDVSESDSATLAKPRSFVDRLSQLSQVLGVAPSDRLLEELPIDLPPLVRRDKLGRRLKRGKHRGSGMRKSTELQNTHVVKKRRKRNKTGVPVQRSDRPKRLPRRFDDSDMQISKKADVGFQDKSVPNAGTPASPLEITKPLNERKPFRANSLRNSRSSSANQDESSTGEQDLRPIRLVVAGKTVSQLKRSSRRNLRSGAGQMVSTAKSTRQSSHHRSKRNATLDSGSSSNVLSSPPDVPLTSSSNQNSLQKRSRRLIMKSRQLQRENSVKTRIADKISSHNKKAKSRQLVLRSSHLPNKTDGRVMLTLRRSVLTQKDLQDNTDAKSDKGSVSSKSSRKKSCFQTNRIIDLQTKFDAYYSFESDGYAHKISLKSAKTLRPSTGVALTKAFSSPLVPNVKAVSTLTSSSHALVTTKAPLTPDGTASKLTSFPNNISESKVSERITTGRALRTRPKTSTKSVVTPRQLLEKSPQHATGSNSAKPRGVPGTSAAMPPKTVVTTTIGQPNTTQPVLPFQNQSSDLKKSSHVSFPRGTSNVAINSSQSTLTKVLEPRKLAPKLVCIPNKRAIAPKPANVLPSLPPQNNMVIIIPSAPVQLPVATNNAALAPVSDSFLEDRLSILDTTTITHGFNMSSELSKVNPTSESRIQVKPHTSPENKTGYNHCSVRLSPLKLDKSTLIAESNDEQPAVTRTSKLRSARAARNIRGIAEDKELMLKRFLAMPELTHPHKRPCLSSTSDSSAGKSYCENSNNDWQIPYDDALKSAALLSDGDAGHSHSVRLANCELGESSHMTDESHVETECAVPQHKTLLGKCHCLDCVLTGNVQKKGPTILAQGLQNSESISKVLHSESCSQWHRMYNSWRTDEGHTVACESATSPETIGKLATDDKRSPQLSPNHHSSVFSVKDNGLRESGCNEINSSKNNQLGVGDPVVKEQVEQICQRAINKSDIQSSPTEMIKCASNAKDQSVGKDSLKDLQVMLMDVKPVLDRMGWVRTLPINAAAFEMASVQQPQVVAKLVTAPLAAKELIEHVNLIDITFLPTLTVSTIEPTMTETHCSPVCSITSAIETIQTELQTVNSISDVTEVKSSTSQVLTDGCNQSVPETYTNAMKTTFEMTAAEPFVSTHQTTSGSVRQQFDDFLLDKMDPNTVECNFTLEPLLENTLKCNGFTKGPNVCQTTRTTCKSETLLAPVTHATALAMFGESVQPSSNRLASSRPIQTLEDQPYSAVAELLQFDKLETVGECSPSVCDVAKVSTYTVGLSTVHMRMNLPIVITPPTCDLVTELETVTPITACMVMKGSSIEITNCIDVVKHTQKEAHLHVTEDRVLLHQSKDIGAVQPTKAGVSREVFVQTREVAAKSLAMSHGVVSSSIVELHNCGVVAGNTTVTSAENIKTNVTSQALDINSGKVLKETPMVPLNLSVKENFVNWKQSVVTDSSMPIDLSVKRKRRLPNADPVNSSAKQQAVMQPPSQKSNTVERPVAVRLDQHFRIVEGPSPTFIQGIGAFPGSSHHNSYKVDHSALSMRRISNSSNAAMEYFRTTQTDGCHDSPDPSDDEFSCSENEGDPQTATSTLAVPEGGESLLSTPPSNPPLNKAHTLPTSTSHTLDSDETVWSSMSDSSDVDIVYGTPDDEQPATHSRLPANSEQQPVDFLNTPRKSDAREDDSHYTAIKRFKAADVVPAATRGRYTPSSKPPSLQTVQSTALGLGLALVDNVYPFFSKVKDCQSALADPMSRNCNRRFDERCPKHLPEVSLRSRAVHHLTQQPAKVVRFELVEPPPSLQVVQQWLHQPATEQQEDVTVEESEPTQSPDSQLLMEEDIVVPASPDTPSQSQTQTDTRTASRASLSSRVSERSGKTSSSSHHHLFSTQLLQSLSDSESRPASRRSAFADKPTDERSLLADQSVSLSEGDVMSFSPIVASQRLADVTAAWEMEKSSIEGLSGRDLAAQTHQVLQQMASHNTAYNDIVTMSMEVHVNTRGTLCPDSTQDEVEAVFLHVHHDTSASDTHHYVLVRSDGRCQQVPVFTSTGPPVSVQQCNGEQQLLEQLVDIVRKHDPDLLVGWEVNNLSWGYIIRRARALNVDLANELSRIPKMATNPNQSFQDPATNNTEFARVGGRVLVNMWKVMRHQMGLGLIPSLTNYNFENVVYHILNIRVPKFTWRDLSDWYTLPKKRQLVLDYYLRRTSLLHTMEQRIDFIGQTSEFARVYGIEFCDVVIKGSQFKVESMMLRIAKPLNFVAVSPNVQQRVRMLPPECIPLTLEPESQFYADPVIVLDFQSLYPSIMIAYNYCFSTCLGHISQLERAGGEDFKFGCTSLRIPAHVLTKVKDHINVSPNGVAFVKQHVRKGVISRMVEEILDTRLMVKRCMSRYKTDKGLHKLLHARQLGLKLIANVTFGYTAANFSGRMPCVEVGDSIVRKARETLERAIKMVNESEKWQSRVVYGDTDSLFVLVPGRSLAEAFKIGEEIRDAVTADNPKPIKLKLEKVYMGCVLQTKKRYAGYMYETADQKEPVFDAKGIETVRRDSIPAVSKMLEKSLITLFATRDVSQVKSYVQKQLTKVLEGKAKLQDFIFAKEYRGLRGYKPTAKVAALLIARKKAAADIWSEPLPAERVPYVIVCGAPGTPLYNLVREPQTVLANPQLKLNTVYYVTRVILPPLHRAFSLLGVNVFSWYEELPKSQRLSSDTSATSVKSTLPQYFSSIKCLVCEGGCQATVCYKCLTSEAQDTIVALNRLVSRQLQLEHAALQICRQCSQMSSDNRVPCISLDCPVLYKRTQLHSQRPLSASICEKYLGKVNNF